MALATQVLSGTYQADPNHSSFEAGVRHMGVGSFRTRFEDVAATLTESIDGRFAASSRSRASRGRWSRPGPTARRSRTPTAACAPRST